jgi:hypothetical protein
VSEVAVATADTDAGAYLTLCARCGRVVRLTDEQAVVAEAERIALDVLRMAFCRRCREAAPPDGGRWLTHR